jgi:hypothetical protein
MPTARELLEQADALMRRNRSAAIDDIPVLTDAIPIDEAPLLGRQRADDDHVSAPVSTDPIPTLTERVESPDAITADLVMLEGEASDWLDFDEAQPSVVGEVPDSIAIVPPVKPVEETDEAMLESAEHEEIELTSAVEDEFDDELAVQAEEAPAWSAPAAPQTVTAAPTLTPPVEEVSVPVEVPAMTPTPDAPVAVEPEATGAPSEPEGLPVPQPVEAAIAPATSPHWDDQARWDMAAEEIRMQVLQRIDLFTDTGLREQLGLRLKPIVDRASADLVATINLHVGELLRAYVAEAIEREIEKWRTDVTKS